MYGGFVALTPADYRGRHTGYLCEFRDVSCHNSSRADNSPTANSYSRQDDSVHADICPNADTDRKDLQVRLDNWNIGWRPRMFRPQHLRARAPSNVIFDDQVSSVEIALWADPDTGPDNTAAIESTLNDSLLTDKYTITDFEGFGMDQADVSPDCHP
jgi:hypothetical protein